jgi:hypothetical protein
VQFNDTFILMFLLWFQEDAGPFKIAGQYALVWEAGATNKDLALM